MYFDWTIILIIPAMIFAMAASAKVKSTFRTYSSVGNRSGLTGARAARALLDRNGLTNIRIEAISGELTDHYDPEAGVIRLSQPVPCRLYACPLAFLVHALRPLSPI